MVYKNWPYLLLCGPIGMEGVLTLDDHNELAQELELIDNWFILGLYLGLSYEELITIEVDHHTVWHRKIEVLWRWLCKGHECTWRMVVEVLIQMRQIAVANTIKLKYFTLTTGRC